MVGLFGPQKYDPITGRKKHKKRYKREVLEDNRMRGRQAEDSARIHYGLQGYEVERTGKGHDFKVRRRNFITGRVEKSHVVEVKSGKAKLSKLQQKTKKKRSNYKVHRVDSAF